MINESVNVTEAVGGPLPVDNFSIVRTLSDWLSPFVDFINGLIFDHVPGGFELFALFGVSFLIVWALDRVEVSRNIIVFVLAFVLFTFLRGLGIGG